MPMFLVNICQGENLEEGGGTRDCGPWGGKRGKGKPVADIRGYLPPLESWG